MDSLTNRLVKLAVQVEENQMIQIINDERLHHEIVMQRWSQREKMLSLTNSLQLFCKFNRTTRYQFSAIGKKCNFWPFWAILGAFYPLLIPGGQRELSRKIPFVVF